MNTIFKKFMALVAIIAGFLTSGKANASGKIFTVGHLSIRRERRELALPR